MSQKRCKLTIDAGIRTFAIIAPLAKTVPLLQISGLDETDADGDNQQNNPNVLHVEKQEYSLD